MHVSLHILQSLNVINSEGKWNPHPRPTPSRNVPSTLVLTNTPPFIPGHDNRRPGILANWIIAAQESRQMGLSPRRNPGRVVRGFLARVLYVYNMPSESCKFGLKSCEESRPMLKVLGGGIQTGPHFKGFRQESECTGILTNRSLDLRTPKPRCQKSHGNN